MGKVTVLLAPAKLNLGLQVLYRLPNGYHYLVSAFAAIDLADFIEVKKDRQFSLHLENQLPPAFRKQVEAAFIPQADGSYDNILYRAWQLMREQAGTRIPPLKLTVVKKIPSPAGLGGASSDAAAFLKYLNQYAKFPKEKLLSLGLSLGADVPFFLTGHKASLIAGIGEPLCPLALRPFYGVVGVPNFGFSTREMFAALKKDLQAQKDQENVQLQAFQSLRQLDWLLRKPPPEAPREFYQEVTKKEVGIQEIPNDFLEAIRLLYPQKAAILKEGLAAAGKAVQHYSGANCVAVGLTGSGSAIYAISPKKGGSELAVADLTSSQRLFNWFSVSSLKNNHWAVAKR